MPPEESRLNRIENKLDDVVRESSELRGEIRQFMTNSDSFVKAVSAKADKIDAACRGVMDAHKADPDAHGAGIKREIDGKLVGWATLGVTVLASFGGIVGAIAHKVMTGGAKP